MILYFKYLHLHCKRIGLLSLTTLLCVALTINSSFAGGPTALDDDSIKIPIFKSKNLRIEKTVSRVSVGNPQIADILILKTSELYIVGKTLGTTNMMIWDDNDDLIDVINLEVTHDLNSLRKRLHQYLPNQEIGVQTSQGQLIVSGQSSSLIKMNTAIQLAQGYADAASQGEVKSEIVNMVSIGGGQQVMLEVTVAEVSTEVARNLDANTLLAFTGSSGNGGVIAGNSNIFPTLDAGFFASYLSGDMLFNFTLDVAKSNGLAKILAEPNITALSGQKAEFLSGGEFPVPVPDEEGTTIEYKDFGVGVSFVPTILDSGKINLSLKVIVSEISNVNSVGVAPIGASSSIVVPSLVKRSAETTIELADGQTLAIGGLLSDNLRDSVSKVPGLGDIPILGQLFSSHEYISGQTELVIMVTPRLVRPFNKEGVPLPTDGFVPVSDLEFYLLGKMTQKENPENDSSPNEIDNSATHIVPNSGGTEQKYGHKLN